MSDEKECYSCGKIKPLDDFYNRSNREGKHASCKRCQNKRQANSRRRKKKELVEYLGGDCSKCGYDKCYAALEFHHKNPEQKEFGVASKLWSLGYEKVKREAEKCILVCSNCHKELECESTFCSH